MEERFSWKTVASQFETICLRALERRHLTLAHLRRTASRGAAQCSRYILQRELIPAGGFRFPHRHRFGECFFRRRFSDPAMCELFPDRSRC